MTSTTLAATHDVRVSTLGAAARRLAPISSLSVARSVTGAAPSRPTIAGRSPRSRCSAGDAFFEWDAGTARAASMSRKYCIGDFFGGHDGREIGVGAGDNGKDGGVHDAQPSDTRDATRGVS